MMPEQWNMVADIGGTNARFGVVDLSSEKIRLVRRYSVTDHGDFIDAVAHFLKDVEGNPGWESFPCAACLALACPITGDKLRFTNSPWFVDRQQISVLLNNATVEMINDFAAVGYAVTSLQPEDWVVVNEGKTDSRSPIVVLGPGTGLGVGTVVPTQTGFQVLAGEGGHIDFCPVDDVEISVLQYLTARFGRVSAERVLSGIGIENVYNALAEISGRPAVLHSAAEISAAAIAGSDPVAVETLELFCKNLGSVAGNLSLALGARGGVYIAGGIIPRFVQHFLNSGFKERFLAKGRFSEYLSDIPVRLITKEDLGLAGAVTKMKLSEH